MCVFLETISIKQRQISVLKGSTVITPQNVQAPYLTSTGQRMLKIELPGTRTDGRRMTEEDIGDRVRLYYININVDIILMIE